MDIMSPKQAELYGLLIELAGGDEQIVDAVIVRHGGTKVTIDQVIKDIRTLKSKTVQPPKQPISKSTLQLEPI